MNRTFATIATIAALTAGTAFAQTVTSPMGEGYNMLQTAIMSDFERMGIATDKLDDLTLGQLAAIKSVLEDGEESNDKNDIEAIIANN